PTCTEPVRARPRVVPEKSSSRLSGVLVAKSRLPSGDSASGRTWPLSKLTKLPVGLPEASAPAGRARGVGSRPPGRPAGGAGVRARRGFMRAPSPGGQSDGSDRDDAQWNMLRATETSRSARGGNHWTKRVTQRAMQRSMEEPRALLYPLAW